MFLKLPTMDVFGVDLPAPTWKKLWEDLEQELRRQLKGYPFNIRIEVMVCHWDPSKRTIEFVIRIQNEGVQTLYVKQATPPIFKWSEKAFKEGEPRFVCLEKMAKPKMTPMGDW